MIAVILVLAFMACGTILFAQYREQIHERDMKREARGDAADFQRVVRRIQELESARATAYDHAAFEDLRTKVEALRLAQGLRSSGR